MPLQFMKAHLSSDRRRRSSRTFKLPNTVILAAFRWPVLFGSDLRILAGLYGTDKASHEYVELYQAALRPAGNRLFFSRSGSGDMGPQSPEGRRPDGGGPIFRTDGFMGSTFTTEPSR